VPIAEPKKVILSLSNDALSVQILMKGLKRAGYTSHRPLAPIQRMRYLSDWTRERSDRAVLELTSVRRPGQSLPSDIGQVMDAMVT
jgi:hypothetical protein